MRVTVVTAEEPGSDVAGGEHVIISVSPWSNASADRADDVRARLGNGELQPDHFEISLELPSGRYYSRIGR